MNEALEISKAVESIQTAGASFINHMIDFAPTLLGALSVLIVGYLVAVLVSVILKAALDRLGVNKRLGEMIEEDAPRDKKSPELKLSLWLSRGVRYLIMLFVLVAFFDVLGIRVVTEPLNELLSQVMAYIPRLLGPALLLLAAWALASLVRGVSRRVLKTLRFDQRLGEQAGYSKATPLSESLSTALYWLVFLLFLPAILDGLALGGLLMPVQAMIEKILSFIPNILAAVLIALVGFFVAKIIQRIVSNLLDSVGVNALSKRASLDRVMGQFRLSDLIGFALYVLILIPVLISALNALQLGAVTEPASQMLASVMSSFPLIFGAVVLMAIAYFVAKILSELLSKLASAAGFDRLFVAIRLFPEKTAEEHKPSRILYYVIFVGILIFAAIEALRLLQFVALADLLSQFLVFAGQLLLGLVIFGVGLFLSEFVAKRLLSSVKHYAKTLALAARVSILILAGAMALRQMGLADDIINMAFGISLGAVAVAVALAFGLGSRDLAGQLAQEWVDKIRKR